MKTTKLRQFNYEKSILQYADAIFSLMKKFVELENYSGRYSQLTPVSANRSDQRYHRLSAVSKFMFLATLSTQVFAEPSQSTKKSKSWPTYGWSAKYDEPNVSRVNLAFQTPPNPSNFTWTVVGRPGARENSAQAYVERELVGLVTWKQVNFGTVIEPLAVRGFKHEIYYKFDAGGGETMWVSGSNLKLSEKR